MLGALAVVTNTQQGMTNVISAEVIQEAGNWDVAIEERKSRAIEAVLTKACRRINTALQPALKVL